MAAMNKGDGPILVVTPLPMEQKALQQRLSGSALFAVATGGHGKVQFALATQRLIVEKRPRLVVCAGSCGSLHEHVKPLDVIVATSTIEHDFKNQFVKRPLPRFAGDEEWLEILRKIQAPSEFALHFCDIASGDEDVIDQKRAFEIHQLTGAHAVAWEGAGGARACQMYHVPFVEIRVATDCANPQTPTDFLRLLDRGMANIAAVLRAIPL